MSIVALDVASSGVSGVQFPAVSDGTASDVTEIRNSLRCWSAFAERCCSVTSSSEASTGVAQRNTAACGLNCPPATPQPLLPLITPSMAEATLNGALCSNLALAEEKGMVAVQARFGARNESIASNRK